MKTIYLFLFLFIVGFKSDPGEVEKAITIIEDLTYEEFYLPHKCFYKTKITITPDGDKIEKVDILYLGKENNTTTTTTFYIEDIDLNSMKFDLVEVEEGLFYVNVQFDAFDNSITEKTLKTNLEKFPAPVSDIAYIKKLRFIPNSKALPKVLAMKYVENVKVLMGARQYERAKLWK